MEIAKFEGFYNKNKVKFELLLEIIASYKRTSFEQNNVQAKQLMEDGILILKDQEYSINYEDKVVYSLSMVLFEKYNLTIPKTFDETIESIKLVGLNLKNSSFILGLHELSNKMISFWFAHLVLEKGLDIIEFIKNHINQDIGYRISDFSKQIGDIIPKMALTKEALFEITQCFLDAQKNPNQFFWDYFQKIREYCRINEKGKEFWLYVIENGTEKFESAVTYAFLGLYESSPSSFR